MSRLFWSVFAVLKLCCYIGIKIFYLVLIIIKAQAWCSSFKPTYTKCWFSRNLIYLLNNWRVDYIFMRSSSLHLLNVHSSESDIEYYSPCTVHLYRSVNFFVRFLYRFLTFPNPVWWIQRLLQLSWTWRFNIFAQSREYSYFKPICTVVKYL